MTKAYIFLVVLLLPSLVFAQREWTDSTGMLRVQAEFAGFSDKPEDREYDGNGFVFKVVTLKTSDGKLFSVPVENLSDKDQEFVSVLQYLRRGKLECKGNSQRRIFFKDIRGNWIIGANGAVSMSMLTEAEKKRFSKVTNEHLKIHNKLQDERWKEARERLASKSKEKVNPTKNTSSNFKPKYDKLDDAEIILGVIAFFAVGKAILNNKTKSSNSVKPSKVEKPNEDYRRSVSVRVRSKPLAIGTYNAISDAKVKFSTGIIGGREKSTDSSGYAEFKGNLNDRAHVYLEGKNIWTGVLDRNYSIDVVIREGGKAEITIR